jgi:hypothetical protein
LIGVLALGEGEREGGRVMEIFWRAFAAGSAVIAILIVSAVQAAAAEKCTQNSSPIETDRPDVTNTSTVLALGSFQVENGVNLSKSGPARIIDGSNTRLRLGIAPCVEVLIDLPSEVSTLRGPGPSGFTNVAPAIKWQISPIPGKVDLSATVGAALPTGAKGIEGPGARPYLQLPWSVELGSGWALTGMVTNFFAPSAPNKYTNQSTLVIERQFGEQSFVFAEYVGDFRSVGGSSHLLNTGGGYRITHTQQVDFHIGFGLNRNAPDYTFGVGYSVRFDRLF